MQVYLDCLGDMCPVPYLKAKKELEGIEKGDSVMLVTDHSCVARSVTEKLAGDNFIIEEEEVMNGVWEITITRA